MADLVVKLENALQWNDATESSLFHVKLLIVDSPRLIASDGVSMEPNIGFVSHLFNKDTVVAIAAPVEQVSNY